MCLAAFASLHAAQGQHESAAELCGSVDALLESLHTGLLPLDQTLYERTLIELHSKMDPTAYSVVWAEGYALTLDQAITYTK